MRKALVYGAGLIALYLVVTHPTGLGSTLTSAGSGGTGLIKALQGR